MSIQNLWFDPISQELSIYSKTFSKCYTYIVLTKIFYSIPDATNTTGPDGQYWNTAPPPVQQQPQQEPLHQGAHARKIQITFANLFSVGFYIPIICSN